MDEFVPIKDFEGRYGVSKSGDVYSYVVNRKINPMKLCGRYNTGYAIYKLTHLDKTYEYRSLKRILAQAFLHDYSDGCEVHIIDKQKPLTADNVEISKTTNGHIIHTRCKVQCVETGKCYESLSELSRDLCGDVRLKAALSQAVHHRGYYKGYHYVLL